MTCTTPTPQQLRALLSSLELTGSQAGRIVGVDGRTIRRWTGGERPIPFASLYTLVHQATGIELHPETCSEQIAEYLKNA